jgi:hypothetical protein
VFPGSYTLAAYLPDERAPYGATLQVEVPAAGSVDVELTPGVEISGKVEVDGEFKLPLSSIGVQLVNAEGTGLSAAPSKTADDGAFTLSRVIPGSYRVEAFGPNVFVKSIQWGGQDVPNGLLDTTAGGAGPLRVVMGAKTATIKGTAPAGRLVEVIAVSSSQQARSGAIADQQGSFAIGGLRPGKYRVIVGGGEMADEDAGEEITVSEGETATVTVGEHAQR